MAASDSDSDDEDYKPEAGEGGSSEDYDDAPDSKKRRLSEQLVCKPQDKAKAEESRKSLWASFEASLAGPAEPNMGAQTVRMIEIERKYRFAGKDISEKTMVPEDSDEARKWLVSAVPQSGEAAMEGPARSHIHSGEALPTEAQSDSHRPFEDVSFTLSQPHCPPSAQPETAQESPVSSVKPAGATGSRPRPGPRKPRVDLTSSKPKKLTLLQKSAMDWSAHLAETDAPTKEELEANRRSGGALGKRDFLDRVVDRRLQGLDSELGKRRRK